MHFSTSIPYFQPPYWSLLTFCEVSATRVKTRRFFFSSKNEPPRCPRHSDSYSKWSI